MIKRGLSKQLLVWSLLVFTFLILIGCNNQNQNRNISSYNKTILPNCEYNKGYNAEEDCKCGGIFSVQKNISTQNRCTHLEKGYVCRKIIDNAIEGEIIGELSENATLDQIKEFAQQNGFELLRFPCNLSVKEWGIVIEIFIGNNDEHQSINKMEKSGLIKNPQRNGIISGAGLN